MGWLTRAIDAGGDRRATMDEIEDGLFITSGERRAKISQFWVLLVLASVIAAGGVLVFTAAGYARVAAARGRHPRRRAKVVITVFVLLLLIPLTGASFRTLEYELWMRTTDEAAHRWVEGTDWDVSGVTQAGNDIVITALGQGDPPSIKALREDVRQDVPSSVDVLVIEESGKTTAL